VRLEGELEGRVLPLLDGSRDREGVLRELGGGVSGVELEEVLGRFAAVGLLTAGE